MFLKNNKCTMYRILPVYGVHSCFGGTLYTGLSCPLLYPRYVLIEPMYNAHPYFPSKFGQKSAHHNTKYRYSHTIVAYYCVM